MGPALLIAFGAPGDPLHDRAFGALDKRAPRVAYVGAANRDHAATFLRTAEGLKQRYDARVTLARTMGDDVSEARRVLEDADLIYLASGDVELLASRLRVHGLDGLLRSCHAAGATVVGVSAGAIALAPYWISYPHQAAGPVEARRFACARVVPFAVDCHDEESDWEELRGLLRRWALDEPDAVVDAYGIPRGGALAVDGRGTVTPVGEAPRWLRLDRGRIVE